MFTKNNIVYSEAGKILVSKTKIGYEMPVSEENIREIDINLDDMKLTGNDKLLSYSGGKVIQKYHKDFSYADWKTEIIKWRYSNDSQIAIILNKDNSEEDMIEFNKMQEWRNWASRLANKILTIK